MTNEEKNIYPRIEISTNGKEVNAYFKKHGVKTETMKIACANDMEFDYLFSATVALYQLFKKEAQKEFQLREKPKYYNGKVFCVESSYPFTRGKIYEVKEGEIHTDCHELKLGLYESFNEVNEINDAVFIEVVE